MSDFPLYHPYAIGRYEVRAGLHQFGTDFGNGAQDQKTFQVDKEFCRYYGGKLAVRSDSLERCYLEHQYPIDVACKVNQFIVERLCHENPEHFSVHLDDQQQVLTCRLTNTRLVFDEMWHLTAQAMAPEVNPPYASSFDALASQIQEDLVVTCKEDDHHWIAALHVCFPGHWVPQEKIGGTFSQIHKPVPGMRIINQRERQYVDQMIAASDGLVRFAWGIQLNDELNQPPHLSNTDSTDQETDLEPSTMFVRVERQTIWGFPEIGSSLFMIRPYLYPIAGLSSVMQRSLREALKGMSEQEVAYKGLLGFHEILVAWLDSV